MFVVVLFIATFISGKLNAIEIGSMTWTPRANWINVKTCSAITGGPNAIGDGSTDDTAAIQAALTYVQNSFQAYIRHPNAWYRTVYFPPGTYKISSTLQVNNVRGLQLIGCGANTTIQWSGSTGAAMFWENYGDNMRYIGLVWDGNNLANCAYEENAAQGGYDGQNRHENESFKNFTQTSTYTFTDQNGNLQSPSLDGSGIIGTFQGGGLVAEMMIFNCKFSNCTTGITNAHYVTNNYMWTVDGCEFDNCGTGINFWSGYDYIVSNCHFQGSTVADITGGGGLRIHHCTSLGSYQFLTNGDNPCVVQDCWVDGWTCTNGAVQLTTAGPTTIYDCTFTHPPAGSLPPIGNRDEGMEVMLSNDYAPDFPAGSGMVDTLYGHSYTVESVPPGARTGIVTSPAQTFLKTAATADSTHIIDVTQSPYTADQSGTNDSTATIKAAIAAAAAAKNGSIVYIPVGFYRITSTLALSGSSFTVQGEGYGTELSWYGGSNGKVFTVTTPTTLSIQNLRIACLNNYPNNPNPNIQYNSSLILSDPTTVTGILETSTGASSMTYDEIYYNSFVDNSPVPDQDNSTGPGLILSNLPAGSIVYAPHIFIPLTVQNCGPATILFKKLDIGMIRLSGTAAKTGFLGADVVEGGQQENSAFYNINVTDNQDLVVGDYYNEQTWNDVSALRGAGTGTGRLTIEGMGSESGNNNGQGSPTISLNVNNYAGRVYYSSQSFSDNANRAPVQVTQSGTNAVDLILATETYIDGASIVTAGTANLIEALNQNIDPSFGTRTFMSDLPNPLTSAATASFALALDHLRQLGQQDISTNYGIAQSLLNNGFEADAINPNPTTTLGYNPASWTVSNSIAAGSGVRNATVTSGGSPFAAGGQSLNWVDTTGSTTGKGLQMSQLFTPTPVASTAIETFDFCCNSGGTSSNVWFLTGIGNFTTTGIHISSNGSTVNLSAYLSGADTNCATLTAGVWYRARVVLGAPNGGKSNATLYVTPWTGTGPGTTNSYTIDGIPANARTGINAFYINSAANPVGSSQNVNFDNIGIVTNATLFLP